MSVLQTLKHTQTDIFLGNFFITMIRRYTIFSEVMVYEILKNIQQGKDEAIVNINRTKLVKTFYHLHAVTGNEVSILQ